MTHNINNNKTGDFWNIFLVCTNTPMKFCELVAKILRECHIDPKIVSCSLNSVGIDQRNIGNFLVNFKGWPVNPLFVVSSLSAFALDASRRVADVQKKINQFIQDMKDTFEGKIWNGIRVQKPGDILGCFTENFVKNHFCFKPTTRMVKDTASEKTRLVEASTLIPHREKPLIAAEIEANQAYYGKAYNELAKICKNRQIVEGVIFKTEGTYSSYTKKTGKNVENTKGPFYYGVAKTTTGRYVLNHFQGPASEVEKDGSWSKLVDSGNKELQMTVLFKTRDWTA